MYVAGLHFCLYVYIWNQNNNITTNMDNCVALCYQLQCFPQDKYYSASVHNTVWPTMLNQCCKTVFSA